MVLKALWGFRGYSSNSSFFWIHKHVTIKASFKDGHFKVTFCLALLMNMRWTSQPRCSWIASFYVFFYFLSLYKSKVDLLSSKVVPNPKPVPKAIGQAFRLNRIREKKAPAASPNPVLITKLLRVLSNFLARISWDGRFVDCIVSFFLFLVAKPMVALALTLTLTLSTDNPNPNPKYW